MINNVLQRIHTDGLGSTVRFYTKAYVYLMSPNYRENKDRYADYSPIRFALFVLYDSWRAFLNRLVGYIEHLMIGRNEIPREQLEEFTVRLLRRDLLNEKSVVYAFGVARHIETEEDLASRVGCTVLMFDPTPPAIEHMATHAPNPKLVFDPIGVWTETKTLRFYNDNRKKVKNLSVLNYYHGSTYIEAPCFTLEDIMKKYGHNHIDLLKMDIEGAALPILLHMLEKTSIRPTQIVGALERPYLPWGATLAEAFQVIRDKGRVYDLLNKEGYKIITHNRAEFTAVKDV